MPFQPLSTMHGGANCVQNFSAEVINVSNNEEDGEVGVRGECEDGLQQFPEEWKEEVGIVIVLQNTTSQIVHSHRSICKYF